MREAHDIWGPSLVAAGDPGGACPGAQITTWGAKTQKAGDNKRRLGHAHPQIGQAFPARDWRHEDLRPVPASVSDRGSPSLLPQSFAGGKRQPALREATAVTQEGGSSDLNGIKRSA